MTHEQVSISKNVFLVLAIGVALLVVSLLYCLYKLSSVKPPEITDVPVDTHTIPESYNVPFPDNLVDFLKEKNIATVTLTNSAGQVKLVGPAGAEIKPCGFEDGMEIKGHCHLKGVTLTAVNQLLIFKGSYNPNCIFKKYGTKWYEVHDGSQSQWPLGAYDCDNVPLSSHVLK
ncbi:MAG: hypothetical protein ACREWG_05195 [Gammaproteobacteria bacterium]